MELFERAVKTQQQNYSANVSLCFSIKYEFKEMGTETSIEHYIKQLKKF